MKRLTGLTVADGKVAFGVGEAIGIFGVLLLRGDRNGSSSSACGKVAPHAAVAIKTSTPANFYAASRHA